MKDLATKIKIMQAALDGKEIECIILNEKDAWEVIRNIDDITWDWLNEDYRIKPEPMEFWVNVYPNGNILSAHETKEVSEENAKIVNSVKSIKVREVIE